MNGASFFKKRPLSLNSLHPTKITEALECFKL